MSCLGLMNDSGKPVAGEGSFLLGIDTCGPSGSVALGRLENDSIEILDAIELEGRRYSATLVGAVSELLARHDLKLNRLAAMVVVSGPGSFTGVRVGLSGAKGLAEVTRIPVVAVSRLEVLAWKAGMGSSALDAHRHEVYLRSDAPSGAREMLAGRQELAAIEEIPKKVAVAEAMAGALLREVWPELEIVAVPAPTAGDALQLCAERVRRREFVDLALLDGHYLRRSDAEIFGETAKGAQP
jgi:tRNA threonylcarbamoyladenosine biosynthesis protein TsaB